MPREIVLRRLLWVGPATIAVAVAAVVAVQQICVAFVREPSKFSGEILRSNEPAYATAFFVGWGVLLFPAIADAASNPLRTFRRLALGVLLVSCIPNLYGGFAGKATDWGMLSLMLLHVVAWAVTTSMLTRLMVSADRRDSAGS
jgi:hypothetical protein